MLILPPETRPHPFRPTFGAYPENRISTGENGTSIRFRAYLELTPPTSSDITINGDYFAKPTEIKAPADTIPWNGVFDDAIQEFLIKWYVVGSGGKAEQILSLKDFFNDAVDSVVPIRDKTAPAHITEEIDWSGMVEESMC